MAVDVQREFKTTQELYTLKYADVLGLIKENGSLILAEKDMDKHGLRATGYPSPGKSVTPRPQAGQQDLNLLPPLNSTRLMKETTWLRYAQTMTPQRNTATRSSQMSKVKDAEDKKSPAPSPFNQTKETKSPTLSHSPYKLEDPRSRLTMDARDVIARAKKKRKKDAQNKENSTKPGKDKFVDYLNQKRELTKQIHLKSNHVEYHERPEQQLKPRLSYPMVRGRYKPEETSIRTRLEEFKKWHENEYRLKYTKARIDGQELQGNSVGRQVKTVEAPAPMLIKKVEPRVQVSLASAPEVRVESSGSSELVDSKRLKLKTEEGQSKPCIVPDEVRRSIQKYAEVKSRQTASTKVTVAADENEARMSARLPVSSAKTWRTWRGVNTSCAYQDVKKYIDDNELMSETKEKMIKDWISDVDRFMPEILEENEGQEAEIPPSYVDPEPIDPTESLSSSTATL